MLSKKITLKSSDGRTIIVDEKVAMMSELIKGMIEDDCTENGIPLPKVTFKTLEKVLKYCEKHADNDKDKADKLSELKAWDDKFIDVDQSVLLEVILAANYLNIKGMLDLATSKAADMIKGKSVEEIRQTFDIRNDFTPEEEEENRKNYGWALE